MSTVLVTLLPTFQEEKKKRWQNPKAEKITSKHSLWRRKKRVSYLIWKVALLGKNTYKWESIEPRTNRIYGARRSTNKERNVQHETGIENTGIVGKWRKADKPVGSPASDHRLIRQAWGLTGQWPQTNQQAAESQSEILSQNKKWATPEDHMRLISHLCTNMESQQNISICSRRILGEFRQIFDTLTRLKEYRDQGFPNSEALGNYHEFSLRL